MVARSTQYGMQAVTDLSLAMAALHAVITFEVPDDGAQWPGDGL